MVSGAVGAVPLGNASTGCARASCSASFQFSAPRTRRRRRCRGHLCGCDVRGAAPAPLGSATNSEAGPRRTPAPCRRRPASGHFAGRWEDGATMRGEQLPRRERLAPCGRRAAVAARPHARLESALLPSSTAAFVGLLAALRRSSIGDARRTVPRESGVGDSRLRRERQHAARHFMQERRRCAAAAPALGRACACAAPPALPLGFVKWPARARLPLQTARARRVALGGGAAAPARRLLRRLRNARCARALKAAPDLAGSDGARLIALVIMRGVACSGGTAARAPPSSPSPRAVSAALGGVRPRRSGGRPRTLLGGGATACSTAAAAHAATPRRARAVPESCSTAPTQLVATRRAAWQPAGGTPRQSRARSPPAPSAPHARASPSAARLRRRATSTGRNFPSQFVAPDVRRNFRARRREPAIDVAHFRRRLHRVASRTFVPGPGCSALRRAIFAARAASIEALPIVRRGADPAGNPTATTALRRSRAPCRATADLAPANFRRRLAAIPFARRSFTRGRRSRVAEVETLARVAKCAPARVTSCAFVGARRRTRATAARRAYCAVQRPVEADAPTRRRPVARYGRNARRASPMRASSRASYCRRAARGSDDAAERRDDAAVARVLDLIAVIALPATTARAPAPPPTIGTFVAPSLPRRAAARARAPALAQLRRGATTRDLQRRPISSQRATCSRPPLRCDAAAADGGAAATRARTRSRPPTAPAPPTSAC